MRYAMFLLPLAACVDQGFAAGPVIAESPVDFHEAELDARAEAAAAVDMVDRARLEADPSGCEGDVAWRGGLWFPSVQRALDAISTGPVVLLCPGVRAGGLATLHSDDVTIGPIGEPLSAALDGDGGFVLRAHGAAIGIVSGGDGQRGAFGLGQLAEDLPAFVVLPDSRGLPYNGKGNFSAGFLPANHPFLAINLNTLARILAAAG